MMSDSFQKQTIGFRGKTLFALGFPFFGVLVTFGAVHDEPSAIHNESKPFQMLFKSLCPIAGKSKVKAWSG
jgi:hypothetical protein